MRRGMRGVKASVAVAGGEREPLLVVEIPMRLENPLNGSQGRSRKGNLWRAAQRKKVRQDIWATLLSLGTGRDQGRVRFGCSSWTIVLTRISPRRFDDDNLRAAFKAVRDGVADWLGVADNDPRVTWQYRQERGQPKQHAVRIEVRQ